MRAQNGDPDPPGSPLPIPLPIDGRDRITVLVHYYRAMVSRADLWRVRMDASTNWAIGTSAGILSFGLGTPALPPAVMLIPMILWLGFLILESRRLTFYHLFQQRVLQLEEGMIRPALTGIGPSDPAWQDSLARVLGTTVPTMSRLTAIARRLRRTYLWLLGVQILAWCFKLAQHPEPTTRWRDLLERAHVSVVPGWAVVAAVLAGFALASILALFRGGPRRLS